MNDFPGSHYEAITQAEFRESTFNSLPVICSLGVHLVKHLHNSVKNSKLSVKMLLWKSFLSSFHGMHIAHLLHTILSHEWAGSHYT